MGFVADAGRAAGRLLPALKAPGCAGWDVPVKTRRVLFWLFLAAGVFLRVFRFGQVPAGANPDELWAGWEAYSLLTTGLDCHGYGWPVYLSTWGSGMNVLETLMLVPLVKIFGLQVWAVRVPQLVVSILTLLAMYGIMRRVGGDVCGLAGLLLLGICPWHVVQSRWALESHLVVGFLVFGLYFFIRGLERFRWLMLSAVMYGLSLYCYAAVWPLLPVLILMQCLYAWRCGKLKNYGVRLLAPVFVLFLFAFPLFLFLAVNFGVLPEIRSPVMSVPKFPIVRTWQYDLSDIPGNISWFLGIAINQTDGGPYNRYGPMGGLYFISAPFILIGVAYSVRELVLGLRKKEPRLPGLLAISLAVSCIQGVIMSENSLNSTKMFLFWITCVMLASYGISVAARIASGFGRPAGAMFLSACLAAYVLVSALFGAYYFTDYADGIRLYFRDGFDEALEDAMSDGGTVYMTEGLNFWPMALFYSGMDPDEYRATVVYDEETQGMPVMDWQVAKSFGRFRFGTDLSDLDPDGTYLMFLATWDFERQDMSMFGPAGFECTQHGYWYVFRRPG